MASPRLIRSCEVCGKEDTDPDVKLLKCARCHYTMYCSKDCQTQDWKKHKATCAPRRVLRKMVHSQRLALKDIKCGECSTDVFEEIYRAFDVHPLLLDIESMTCGHVAHTACLQKRSDTNCPTCGASDSFNPSDLLPENKRERREWYDEETPQMVLCMVLGHIFHAEMRDRTGDNGSLDDQLAFVNDRTEVIPDMQELMESLRQCMRIAQNLSYHYDNCWKTRSTDSLPVVDGLRHTLSVKLTKVLEVPFTHDLDTFMPYIARWLGIAGIT